jgi:hypothetical protein
VGDPPAAPPPLPAIHHDAVEPELERAVRARLARGVRQVGYMGRFGLLPRQASSVPARGRAAPRGGRDVMWGRSYSRKPRTRDVHRAAERVASSEPSASGQAVSISG